jgi:hypothetical protein
MCLVPSQLLTELLNSGPLAFAKKPLSAPRRGSIACCRGSIAIH